MFRLHFVARRENLDRVAVVVPCLQHAKIGFGNLRIFLSEFLFNEPFRDVERTVIHPVHQTEREKVLRLVNEFGGEVHVGECIRRHLADGNAVHLVAAERAIFERVTGNAGELEILLGEAVFVDDDRSPLAQNLQVGDQCGGIHCNENIRRIARRQDIAASEANLEAAHAVGRSGGSAYFRGIVRERAHIVSENGSGVRKLRSRQLHTVTRIPGKPDGNVLESSYFSFHVLP